MAGRQDRIAERYETLAEPVRRWGPRVFAIARPDALAFSVPYVWLWTAGLATGTRWALLIAHACALLSALAWSTAVEQERGQRPRLGPRMLAAGASSIDARLAAGVLSGAAVIASLPAVALHPAVPVAMAVAVAAGWAWARLGASSKFLLWPELAGPVAVLVVPALGLAALGAPGVGARSVAAGSAFLAALVLAGHLRDRDADLADDVPTLATRRPADARGWLWAAALAGCAAALAGLYRPLSLGESLAVASVTAMAVALPLPRGRACVIASAHGLYGLALLLL